MGLHNQAETPCYKRAIRSARAGESLWWDERFYSRGFPDGVGQDPVARNDSRGLQFWIRADLSRLRLGVRTSPGVVLVNDRRSGFAPHTENCAPK